MRPRDREALERQIAELESSIRLEHVSGYWAAAVFVLLAAALVAYAALTTRLGDSRLPFIAGALVLYAPYQIAKDRRATRDSRAELADKRAELAAGRVRVVRCEASEMVRLDDDDPEDAIYAFQVEPNRIFFVAGDEYHQAEGFPSRAFEIIHPVTNDGDPDDEILEVAPLGARLEPVRVIPASVTSTLRYPDDQSEVEGRLEDLEGLLARE